MRSRDLLPVLKRTFFITDVVSGLRSGTKGQYGQISHAAANYGGETIDKLHEFALIMLMRGRGI